MGDRAAPQPAAVSTLPPLRRTDNTHTHTILPQLQPRQLLQREKRWPVPEKRESVLPSPTVSNSCAHTSHFAPPETCPVAPKALLQELSQPPRPGLRSFTSQDPQYPPEWEGAASPQFLPPGDSQDANGNMIETVAQGKPGVFPPH